MTAWRSDMENAPRDGSEILLGRKGLGWFMCNVAYWDETRPKHPWHMIDGDKSYALGWPTHWMPLPEPPQ